MIKSIKNFLIGEISVCVGAPLVAFAVCAVLGFWYYSIMVCLFIVPVIFFLASGVVGVFRALFVGRNRGFAYYLLLFEVIATLCYVYNTYDGYVGFFACESSNFINQVRDWFSMNHILFLRVWWASVIADILMLISAYFFCLYDYENDN